MSNVWSIPGMRGGVGETGLGGSILSPGPLVSPIRVPTPAERKRWDRLFGHWKVRVTAPQNPDYADALKKIETLGKLIDAELQLAQNLLRRGNTEAAKREIDRLIVKRQARSAYEAARDAYPGQMDDFYYQLTLGQRLIEQFQGM